MDLCFSWALVAATRKTILGRAWSGLAACHVILRWTNIFSIIDLELTLFLDGGICHPDCCAKIEVKSMHTEQGWRPSCNHLRDFSHNENYLCH